MNSTLIAYLAIFTPVLALGLLGGWIATHLWDCYQARKPIPLVPTDAGIDALAVAVTCPWCRPKPVGRCTCGIACHHERCVRLSLADLEYLDGRAEMPR